jgi:hypothetical protein
MIFYIIFLIHTVLKLFLILLAVFLLSTAGNPDYYGIKEDPVREDAVYVELCTDIYNDLSCNVQKPDITVFREALTGFLNLNADNRINKNILTIIDFTLSSNKERMWIIDLGRLEVIHLGLVAHGRNSGGEFASSFSNSISSNKSSLGFYITGKTYRGKHGLSLYLDGEEPGINDNARARAIVMHGAGYVSKDFITEYGRLGRSFGCPAIPLRDHDRIINLLAGGSCIYIHSSDRNYHEGSRLLSEKRAISGLNLFITDHNIAQ